MLAGDDYNWQGQQVRRAVDSVLGRGAVRTYRDGKWAHIVAAPGGATQSGTQRTAASPQGLQGLRGAVNVTFFRERTVGNIAIFTVANHAYLRQLTSWLEHLHRLRLAQHASIVCVGRALQAELQRRGRECHPAALLVARKKQGKKSRSALLFERIAPLRFRVAAALNLAGLDVLYTGEEIL